MHKRIWGRKNWNLYLLLNVLGFGSFVEICDIAEPSTAVLDKRDGRSPSTQRFGWTILRLQLEVLQQFLHLSLSKSQSITKLSFSFFNARYSEEQWFEEVLVLEWVVWQAWKEITGVNGKSSYIRRRWLLRWRLQMDGYFTLAHVLSIHWRNRARKARTDNQWHDMKNVFKFIPRFHDFYGFLYNPN